MNQPRQLDPGSIKRGRLTRLLVAKLGISVNLCIAYYYQQQQQTGKVTNSLGTCTVLSMYTVYICILIIDRHLPSSLRRQMQGHPCDILEVIQ